MNYAHVHQLISCSYAKDISAKQIAITALELRVLRNNRGCGEEDSRQIRASSQFSW